MSTTKRKCSKSSNTSSTSCDSGDFDRLDITIVKKGHISIKRPPSNSKLRLKAWQTRFIILRDATSETGSTRLEIYDCEGAWRENRKNEQFIVKLDRVSGVEEYHDSKRFHDAFMVSRRGQGPLVMACETELELKEWMVAIQLLADKDQHLGVSRRPSLPVFNSNVSPLFVRPTFQSPRAGSPRKISNGSLNNLSCEQSPRGRKRSDRANALEPAEFLNTKTGFRVETCITRPSEHFGLSGPYVMHIEKNMITLTHIDDVTTVIAWRLKDITKFKCEGNVATTDDTVTLECKGLNNDTEQFIFVTRYGRDLVQKVTSAVGNQRSQDSFQQRVVRQNAIDRLTVMKTNLEKSSSTPCLTLDALSTTSRGIKQSAFQVPVSTTLPLSKKNKQKHSDNNNKSNGSSDDDIPSYQAPPPPPRPTFSIVQSQDRRRSASRGSSDELEPDLDTPIPALPPRKISVHSK